MGFVAAIRGQFGELLHVLIAGVWRIAVVEAASSGELLQAGVEHSCEKSMLESLMEVADLPEFIFDPAGFDFFLVLRRAWRQSSRFSLARRKQSPRRACRS